MIRSCHSCRFVRFRGGRSVCDSVHAGVENGVAYGVPVEVAGMMVESWVGSPGARNHCESWRVKYGYLVSRSSIRSG